jgi:glycogen debranching enzyme
MFDASLFVDLHRMPELFCGFPRRPGGGRRSTPVACAPQSWAAAAAFLLPQACPGLRIDGVHRRISFCYPAPPRFLKRIRIRNSRVGDAAVDLRLERHRADVGINVLGREGDGGIAVVK